MQDLNVTLIQTNLHWENPEANRQMFERLLNKVDNLVDLIVLPEMFNTGFTMNVKQLSETSEGRTLNWMREKAAKYKSVITGSILTEDGGRYFNRMFWVRPDGGYEFYDKHHLFRMVNEHKIMTQGDVEKIVELKGWKIKLQVCYDLRFPVWSRNRYRDGQYAYDILIYVSNWPAIRRNAYIPLLQARAIENQAYLLWVNRIGKDGNGVDHAGDTMGLDAKGQTIKQANSHQEDILTLVLSANELTKYRDAFKVGLDWDHFEVY